MSRFHTDSFWLWLVLTQTRFGRDLFWRTRFDTDSLWHRLVLAQTRFTDLFWHKVVLAPRRRAIRILEWHRHLPPLVTFISDFSCRVSYRVYYFFFPPKHKFLSQEEYVIQGSEETSRALEDLREYCNSPECNTWKVVSRLKHPTRYDDAKLDFKLSGRSLFSFVPWMTLLKRVNLHFCKNTFVMPYTVENPLRNQSKLEIKRI